jgi:hypothetical protein
VPPRHAYWTILIDAKPTAFRAREQEELLPTFHQLQRKNTQVEMKWFARGRLWETQQAERDDFQRRKHPAGPSGGRGDRPASRPGDHDASRGRAPEGRSGDWRPGGSHKDPRDRFKKKNRPDRMWSEGDARRGDRPQGQRFDRPAGPPRGDRPQGQRFDKPTGPPSGDRPPRTFGKAPGGGAPRGSDSNTPAQEDAMPERREADPPPKPPEDSTATPPPPERVGTKPKPPERG